MVQPGKASAICSSGRVAVTYGGQARNGLETAPSRSGAAEQRHIWTRACADAGVPLARGKGRGRQLRSAYLFAGRGAARARNARVTAAIGRALSKVRGNRKRKLLFVRFVPDRSGSVDACRRERATATPARIGNGDEPLTQFDLHRGSPPCARRANHQLAGTRHRQVTSGLRLRITTLLLRWIKKAPARVTKPARGSIAQLSTVLLALQR
jgi:hypothetical protein